MLTNIKATRKPSVWSAFSVHVIFGLIVFALVMQFAWPELRRSSDASRYNQWNYTEVCRKVEEGYFSDAGFVRIKKKVWTSYTGFYVAPLYIPQKAHHLVTGNCSERLFIATTQLWIAMVGLAAVFFARQATSSLKINYWVLFTLGFCLQFLIQTFPYALDQGVKFRYSWAFLAFGLTFLTLLNRSLNRERISNRALVALSLLTFAMTLVEYIASLFLVAAITGLLLLTGGWQALRSTRPLITMLAPFAAALFVHALQLGWISSAHPDIALSGNLLDGPSSRMGLTKLSHQFFEATPNLLSTDASVFSNRRGLLGQWRDLFVFGLGALLILLITEHKARESVRSAFAVLPLLSIYFLYFCVFWNSVLVHPMIYDAYLFIPLVICLVFLLPANLLSRRPNHPELLIIPIGISLAFGFHGLRIFNQSFF